jgi:hypothetical protein
VQQNSQTLVQSQQNQQVQPQAQPQQNPQIQTQPQQSLLQKQLDAVDKQQQKKQQQEKQEKLDKKLSQQLEALKQKAQTTDDLSTKNVFNANIYRIKFNTMDSKTNLESKLKGIENTYKKQYANPKINKLTLNAKVVALVDKAITKAKQDDSAASIELGFKKKNKGKQKEQPTTILNLVEIAPSLFDADTQMPNASFTDTNPIVIKQNKDYLQSLLDNLKQLYEKTYNAIDPDNIDELIKLNNDTIQKVTQEVSSTK